MVACDGLNSRVRTRYADTFRPDIDTRKCRFVWLGTKKKFDAFTFAFEQTEHGWFQAHAYQYDGDTSTFIVETPEEVWRTAGLDEMSQEEGIAFCEKLFAKYLDGNHLVEQCHAPARLGHVDQVPAHRLRRAGCSGTRIDGRRVPVVLMGDAAHTAHFSIGSGTKLALEDAIELARCFSRQGVDWHRQGAGSCYQKLRAASKCSSCKARRAIRWSGSRTSSAIRRWRPSSSPTRC